MTSKSEFEVFPIPSNTFVLTSTYTRKAITYKAQIMKKVDGVLVVHSPIFELTLRPSIGESVAQEIVPPAFKTAYDEMVDVAKEVKDKLDKGEFKDYYQKVKETVEKVNKLIKMLLINQSLLMKIIILNWTHSMKIQ